RIAEDGRPDEVGDGGNRRERQDMAAIDVADRVRLRIDLRPFLRRTQKNAPHARDERRLAIIRCHLPLPISRLSTEPYAGFRPVAAVLHSTGTAETGKTRPGLLEPAAAPGTIGEAA